MYKKSLPLVLAALVAFAAPAPAAESLAPPKQHWKHHGVLGTYDRGALQRGFQVYKQVCAACHGMKLLSYRNLAGIGYNEDEIKAIAAEYTVIDGPDEDGEMFERAARPSDRFKAPFANDRAARAANGGALPPDMSLIVKASHHHEDYILALLTGYTTPPATDDNGEPITVPDGMYWNKYFAGNLIAMAPPLVEDGVSYADGTAATVEQMALDVTQFLAWAGEPHMEERKQMGIKVILFMLVFAGIMLAAKRKVWAAVH
jgi:ubiquinol-cytochrome c reductase cytochrome c1 subunit